MSNLRLKRFLKPAMLVASASIVLVGCGGGGGGGGIGGIFNNSIRTYVGTQAPGDAWTWSFSNNTDSFNATDSGTSYNYSGLYVKLSNGFEALEITSSTDPNVVAPITEYGFEIANTVFFAKPAGLNTEPIICAAANNSPTSATLSYNYIHIPEHAYRPDTGIAYGAMAFSSAGSTLNGILTKYSIQGSPIQPNQTFAATEANGRLKSGSITGALTESGIAVLDLGKGAGGAFGLQTPSTAISLSDLTSKYYAGFDQNPTNGSQLIYGTPAVNSLFVGSFTDISTGTKQSGYATVAFTGQPSPGLVTATVTYGTGATNPAVFVVSQVNGKYLLEGIIRHPLGSAQLTLIQQ